MMDWTPILLVIAGLLSGWLWYQRNKACADYDRVKAISGGRAYDLAEAVKRCNHLQRKVEWIAQTVARNRSLVPSLHQVVEAGYTLDNWGLGKVTEDERVQVWLDAADAAARET